MMRSRGVLNYRPSAAGTWVFLICIRARLQACRKAAQKPGFSP